MVFGGDKGSNGQCLCLNSLGQSLAVIAQRIMDVIATRSAQPQKLIQAMEVAEGGHICVHDVVNCATTKNLPSGGGFTRRTRLCS